MEVAISLVEDVAATMASPRTIGHAIHLPHMMLKLQAMDRLKMSSTTTLALFRRKLLKVATNHTEVGSVEAVADAATIKEATMITTAVDIMAKTMKVDIEVVIASITMISITLQLREITIIMRRRKKIHLRVMTRKKNP